MNKIKNIILFTFNKKLSFFLITGFVIATIVGTVSHELGHYIIAKSFGYESTIQYDRINPKKPSIEGFIDSVFSKHGEQIESNQSFPGKEHFLAVAENCEYENRWITLGGPLQTMLTGTIGLALIFFYCKSFALTRRLNAKQWILIFISLFWLRQTANFAVSLINHFIAGKVRHYGDEISIAHYFGLPSLSLVGITGIIGAIVLSIVVFKFIPIKDRFTFLVSGLVGGILGSVLWFIILGPLLMP